MIHYLNIFLFGYIKLSTTDGFLSCLLSEVHKLTLVRVMLNWMVRMTTRMSKLPSEISVNDLSVYHEMFFNICERDGDKAFKNAH